MKLFKARDIRVEAVLWTGQNQEQIRKMVPATWKVGVSEVRGQRFIGVDDPDGSSFELAQGDWLVKTPRGEITWFENDVFMELFELTPPKREAP